MAKETPKKPQYFNDFKRLAKKLVQVPKEEIDDAPKAKPSKKK